MLNCQSQYRFDIKIAADGLSGYPDLLRLISLKPMQRIAVFMTIDSDSLQAQLMRTAKNTNRNLAAIGDQDTFNFSTCFFHGDSCPLQ